MPRQKATANRQATTDARKSGNPVIGYSFVHTAVDDHSRLAYSEVLTDERKETASSGSARTPSSSPTASPSNASSPTTAPATDPGCSPRRSAQTTLPTSGRDPIARRRTARWSASIAPCSTNGRTCARTPATPNAPKPWRTSSIPTTTTDATPHSMVNRPSVASTTLRVNTSRACPTGRHSPCDSPSYARAGAPRGAWLRGALWGSVDLLPVVRTALAEVVRQIGHSAALPALRRGDDGWGTLCGGGGGGACEAESGEGCRGDDGGEDSSSAHLVPLSGIASVAALASVIFDHVGGTSCCAIRVTWLSGAGPLTRPAQGLRRTREARSEFGPLGSAPHHRHPRLPHRCHQS